MSAVYNLAIVLDDHKLFATSFALLLERTGLFQKVAAVYDLQGYETAAREEKYRMLFIDYLMPGINTIDEINRLHPRENGLHVIAVTSVYNSSIISSLFHAGCSGYLAKNASPDEIEQCIRTVAAGKLFVSTEQRSGLISAQLLGTGKGLFTPREMELLPHIAAGKTIQETAGILHVSHYTVANHRRRMMEKAEVKSIGALIRFAMEMGLV